MVHAVADVERVGADVQLGLLQYRGQLGLYRCSGDGEAHRRQCCGWPLLLEEVYVRGRGCGEPRDPRK